MVEIVKLEKNYTEIKSNHFGSVMYSMKLIEKNRRSLTARIVINIGTNKISRPIINIFNVI